MMKHMHRPDPERPPEMQDQRMVVVLPEAQYAGRLDAPAESLQQTPARTTIFNQALPNQHRGRNRWRQS
jgi:hypothetical protein